MLVFRNGGRSNWYSCFPIGTFQNVGNGPNEEADALYLIEELGKRGIAYLHMSEPDWAGGEPYTDAFREKVRARFHGPIIGAGAYTPEKRKTCSIRA